MAPPTPQYVSATTTSVTLKLANTQDNGGSLILTTKLFRDAGNISSEINIPVTDYAGEPQYTVTGLSPMTAYRFVRLKMCYPQSSSITVQTSTY